MMTELNESIRVLRTKIKDMNPKSKNFAQSLLNQYDAKGSLSPKQEYWVHKLAGTEGDKRTKVHEKTAQVIELETYGRFLVKESSRNFASDLVKRWQSHGNFSAKQQYWVNVLIEKGKAEGKKSLRRAQFEEALAGDARMLMFLGKNWLGQQDSPTDEESTAPLPWEDK